MRRPGVRKFLLVCLLAGVGLAIVLPGTAQADDTTDSPVVVTLFWGQGCPHCAKAKEFLADLQAERPEVTIDAYEVYNDPDNAELFRETAELAGTRATGVPTIFLGDRYWVGFSDSIADDIDTTVAAVLLGRSPGTTTEAAVSIPIVGDVKVSEQSLLVSTLLIGFVDGVNPCSLWVLSILLAIVLHSGSRGRVFSVGAVFLVVTAAMYGLYMTGLYSALDFVSSIGWIRLVVAATALVFGVIHVKDYFRLHEGPTLSIPDSSKPGMYQRMRSVAAPDRSWVAALGGTAVLAVGVSLLETPCTAGLPLLWTSLLAANDVSFGTAAALFAVYMAVFLLDELVVFTLAVVTLRAARVQERHGRLLKLLSGTVMITLALVLIAAPALLESVTGALAVFTAAALIVLIVDRGTRLLQRQSQAGQEEPKGQMQDGPPGRA
jgi:cytochrome c biogenesis protein CcdA/glutaredoxin